jgi:Ser/Thr protein kinase RdoA (MazF antagonist)
MRQLARAALDAYGLSDARFRLLRQAGNTLFRVVEASPALVKSAGGLFAEGHYLLRIHHPGYQPADAIALELEWLAALRRDADAPVPEPVPTLQSRLMTEAGVPGIPGRRNCSLLRWLKGRFIRTGIEPRHLRAQGRLMAQLHGHASQWRPPPGLTKRSYDWDGLFRDDSGAGIPAREAWPLLPRSSIKPFGIVAQKVRHVVDAWGKGPDVYGLIHADLGVDANVLFCGGEARAIDFDDSGFGYWVYDLAVSLEHCQEDAAFDRFRDALLDGYAEGRCLPEGCPEHLELFLAAFHVYWSLWAVALIHLNPKYREELRNRMERAARLVRRYVAGN